MSWTYDWTLTDFKNWLLIVIFAFIIYVQSNLAVWSRFTNVDIAIRRDKYIHKLANNCFLTNYVCTESRPYCLGILCEVLEKSERWPFSCIARSSCKYFAIISAHSCIMSWLSEHLSLAGSRCSVNIIVKIKNIDVYVINN